MGKLPSPRDRRDPPGAINPAHGGELRDIQVALGVEGKSARL
jgi:hypothetical protein